MSRCKCWTLKIENYVAIDILVYKDTTWDFNHINGLINKKLINLISKNIEKNIIILNSLNPPNSTMDLIYPCGNDEPYELSYQYIGGIVY